MTSRSCVERYASELKRFTVTQLQEYTCEHVSRRYLSQPTIEYWVRVLYQEGWLCCVGSEPAGRRRKPARVYEWVAA